MNKRSIAPMVLSLSVLAGSVAAQPPADHGVGSVTGAGYAVFDAGGAPGDNLYWVTAVSRPGTAPDKGLWYADVFIAFPGFDFDFEALYSVDCAFVDRSSGEAWVEGTIIESNDPANLGNRATLYIKDGGPGGEDQHGITPLAADAPRNHCETRPEPDFRETAQSGDYIIR